MRSRRDGYRGGRKPYFADLTDPFRFHDLRSTAEVETMPPPTTSTVSASGNG